MKEREHLWNIFSYMLVYLLLGFVVGFGIGNLFILVGLGLLSYGLNWYMLGKLDLPAVGIVEVKKRFFVLTWKWFYINLLFTVMLTMKQDCLLCNLHRYESIVYMEAIDKTIN